MKARTWIATLALVVLQLAAPLAATAQVNLTVTPQAPPEVESALSKGLGIASLVVIAAGILALLWGGFKLATGQEGAGKFLVGGAIALVIGININGIVAWLTS